MRDEEVQRGTGVVKELANLAEQAGSVEIGWTCVENGKRGFGEDN